MDPTTIGPYDVVRKLGEGGMGRVFLAHHRVLSRYVVVKQILPALAADPVLVRRFFIEAQAAARLAHRNVVAIHDCQTTNDGVPYIVLEYLRGQSLRDWIEGWVATRGPRIPVTYCTIVLAQAANALDAAHAAGIVHRDIKPDNLFLTEATPSELHARLLAARLPIDLHVKVLDFGIAKLVEHRGGGGTGTGIGVGTPAYMAPEQLKSAVDADGRADVYSLGAVAFQLLTGGQLPWGTETPAVEIYARQHSEPPPDPRQTNPLVPLGLAVVVRKAMARDPNQRWSTPGDFMRAFAATVPADDQLPSGMELLRAYAPELAHVTADAMTMGRIAVIGGPATDPLPLAPTPTPVLARAADQAAPESAVMAAATPTTLGSSVGVAPARPSRGRMGLGLALGAITVVIAGIVLAVSLGSDAPPMAPAAGTTVSTDAAGADTAIAVDASLLDAAPVDAAPGDAAPGDAAPGDAAPAPTDARTGGRARPSPKPPSGDESGSSRGFRDLTK